MSAYLASDVRPAAVAGLFYSGDRRELEFQLDRMMVRARGAAPPEAAPPHALVVPHAGYTYSGTVAADAYARLAPIASGIRRVVLFGPAHRVAVAGMAVPSVAAFETPLGRVPIDLEVTRAIAREPGIAVSDEAHRQEHSLEVQLPFLQEALGDFLLVPVLVGDAAVERVADLMHRLWGGPETLVVVSSDLSHHHDYDSARRLDASTCAVLETLTPGKLDGQMACGARPLEALIRVARRRDLRATTLALRNSGDSAGDRRRVVGYGAWSFSPNRDTEIGVLNRRMLLTSALRTLRAGASRRRRPNVAVETFDREIQCRRAAFVSLQSDGRLRGCIGSLTPQRPLVADVVWNAYSAAFQDPRFPPVEADEIDGLHVSVSVLGAAVPLTAADETALLAALRPGVDGLILTAPQKRALFLPTVWQQLAEPAAFVAGLKRKAGLAPDAWPEQLKFYRFSTETFGADAVDIGP